MHCCSRWTAALCSCCCCFNVFVVAFFAARAHSANENMFIFERGQPSDRSTGQHVGILIFCLLPSVNNMHIVFILFPFFSRSFAEIAHTPRRGKQSNCDEQQIKQLQQQQQQLQQQQQQQATCQSSSKAFKQLQYLHSNKIATIAIYIAFSGPRF